MSARRPTGRMPLVDSEAIILRSAPLGEADKLVSFLARGAGRLRGVARGARRPRNRFGAGLEPLSHVRLWFYDRAHRELVRLSQCELIEPFWQARSDYAGTVALSHLAELCERLLPEREPSERVFRLLLVVLEGIKTRRNVWLALAYFQLWMLRLAGWLPALERCNRCQREFGENACYLGLDATGALCRGCRKRGMRVLAASSRKLALELLAQPLPHLAPADDERDRSAELRKYLLDVIEHHTERKLATRELLDGLE